MDVSQLPDEELVQYIRSTEHHAYRELITRYETSVMRYIRSLVGNELRAHELAQDTFVNAFADLASFRSSEQFSNWIHRYAHEEVINFFKKEGKLRTGEGESFEEDFSTIDSEVELKNPNLVRDVMSKSSKLPLMYQDVLVLHFVCQKSVEEVAEILQLPTRVIESRIASGANRLKMV